VREIQLVRAAGALTVLPLALSANIVAQIFAGELVAAASLIDEVKTTTEATGSHLAPYGALIHAAWRGRDADLSALIHATLQEVVHRGEGIGVTTTQWANALLHNAPGRYDEALVAAQEVIQPPGRLDATVNWVLPELIEAAGRTGHVALAHDALQQLCEMTQPAGTDWALALEARSRALLNRHKAAELPGRATATGDQREHDGRPHVGHPEAESLGLMHTPSDHRHKTAALSAAMDLRRPELHCVVPYRISARSLGSRQIRMCSPTAMSFAVGPSLSHTDQPHWRGTT
jgi:hypothetical protein